MVDALFRTNGRTWVSILKAPSTKYAIQVTPGRRVTLDDYDTAAPADLSQDEGDVQRKDLLAELADLQQEMFGAAAQPTMPGPTTTPAAMPFAQPQQRRSHSLLVVIQGTDGAGKDGLIRSVFGRLNPLWTNCQGFKAATFDEIGRDFLWRSHREVPAPGYTTVFHRSYYEGVLAERVHEEVPEEIWMRRYDAINSFEAVLRQANTVVMKFLLHISKDEQKQRLLDREENIATAFKLSPVDWQERQLWDDYQDAFEDMLSRTSTEAAPWCIVPADEKWFARLAVADAVVSRLRPLRAGWRDILEEMQATQLDAIDEVGRV
jgi:PPK2 family polyphosphate:nucleotide phosphotransferase